MKHIVHLAGPITYCSYEGCTDWRERFILELTTDEVQPISPMRGKPYLKGVSRIALDYPDSVMSCQRGIMVRDHFDVKRSTVMVVNLLGTKEVSIGTVIEMAWAWDNQIPIVCMIEEKDNVHDHPMLREAIGFRVKTEDEALHVIRTILWCEGGNNE